MVFLRTHQPYSWTEVLMETKLERIAEISAHSPRPEFTSLYHLINKEMLLQCHKELDGSKAVGIDEITKKEYERNLEQNIDDLVERLKRKSYKPQPSIRVYIPKSNGKLRPLGIACYEDKMVQLALKKILEAIYEPRFLNCMYGFRPNRGCHDAIKELYKRLNNTKICYIVDADIKGFFDHMKHEWIIKFLYLYIKDPNIIGLVKKYLKVGVIDGGELMMNEEGSAQGNIISPILANIYMRSICPFWILRKRSGQRRSQSWKQRKRNCRKKTLLFKKSMKICMNSCCWLMMRFVPYRKICRSPSRNQRKRRNRRTNTRSA